MTREEVAGLLDFLRRCERLKDTLRSGYTSGGRRESVADHTWRLCLMAMLIAERFPDVDVLRLLQMLIVHDLGEVVGGDIPAPEQTGSAGKSVDERRDFRSLLGTLPPRQRAHLIQLWDEYDAAATPTARLAKALDKLETLLQHTQGDNPPDFDYEFNLTYGDKYTTDDATIAAIRSVIDEETARRAAGG